MDEKGYYGKFYQKAHVADAIGAHRSTISKYLCTDNVLYGFAFAYADEIEVEDSFGRTVLDLEKLANKFKEKEGFYSVDKDGNFQIFETPRQASDKLKYLMRAY